MGGQGARYKIPAEIVKDATANHARYNAEVRQLMVEMGVPEDMIGIAQFGRDKTEAFSLSSAVGGTHSVPVHGERYVPEISVDLAALDPNFPHMVQYSPSWSAAAFRDRAQAVIVHEFEEAMIHHRGVNLGEYPPAISRALEQTLTGTHEQSIAAQQLVHDYGHYGAILLALNTSLRNLSETARRILQEYSDSSPRF